MENREKKKLLKKIVMKMEGERGLVEGKKDIGAISGAGISARVMAVSNRKPDSFAELISGGATGPVLLLFDFDVEGRRKAAEYETALIGRGVPVDRQGRKAFRTLFRLRTIEELPHAMLEVELEIG